MPSPSLPSPRVLLGPGPLSVSPRVLLAMAKPPIGYLDPELFEILEQIQIGLRAVFGTSNAFTIAHTGTGMAGMESCFANLVEPGDRVLIAVNGFFGGRMAEIAGRFGAEVVRVDAEWGRIVDPDAVAAAAERAGRLKLVACVHAETSTGAQQPLEPIAEVARRHDALFLVDAVTSLGGLPVEVDRIGIDACYSASQKCMGCPPGLAPITVSERAMDVARKRSQGKSRTISWYGDWSLLELYWSGARQYHHTVPVSNLFGLQESLAAIAEEGLEARFSRHRAASDRLVAGVAELGFRPFAQEGHRQPTLNTLTVPAGVDEAQVRGRLLREYGIEIGGGLGALKGRILRVGTMGEAATPRNVEMLLGALRAILGTA